MSLKEFFENYDGNAIISIEGYCEEWLSDDNPKKESWWEEIKDRRVKSWGVIGGGIYKVEIMIKLE